MRTFVLAAIATLAMSLPAVADEVRIGVGSYNLNNLPFPLAEGLGYYKDEGLEVTTENFASGGSKALQALVAGSTDIAVGFYDHTIQMQAQNKDVVAVVLLARNSGLVMAGRPDATFDPAKPETIKGAKVGITAPGSSSDFFVRYYLQRNGLSPDDVSLIGVGSGSSAVAALEQGKIDVLVNYDPAATFIEEKKPDGQISRTFIDSGTNPPNGVIVNFYLKERPEGEVKLDFFDRDGNLWVALMYQGGVAKLDRKTGKVQTWSVPKEWQTDATQQSFLSPTSWHVDGKVWVKNSDRAQILRLDPATGAWENFGTFTDPSTKRNIGSYGINADRNNKLYMLDFNAASIGILDGGTKQLELVKTAIPNSRPRRGSVDAQNRLWFAEYDGDAIAMLDPRTKQIKEWPVPTKWSNPYDVVIDKNGDAWTGSMMNDRILRLNTTTGAYTEYLLPNPTNIRRVWVDNSTTPVTLWVGSDRGASIVKLERRE